MPDPITLAGDEEEDEEEDSEGLDRPTSPWRPSFAKTEKYKKYVDEELSKFMAKHSMDAEQVSVMQKLVICFQAWDTDGSMAIDPQELTVGVKSLGCKTLDGLEKDTRKMLDECDADGNGVIDLEEWLTYMRKNKMIQRKIVKALECHGGQLRDRRGELKIFDEDEYNSQLAAASKTA